MARIIHTAFTFQHPNQEKQWFEVGDVVEGDLAEHWYVQHHSDDADVPKAKRGRKGASSDDADAADSTQADTADAVDPNPEG